MSVFWQPSPNFTQPLNHIWYHKKYSIHSIFSPRWIIIVYACDVLQELLI